MSRIRIAAAAALLAALAGLAAPAPARADTGGAQAVVTPSQGDEMVVLARSGTGFAPNSTVTVSVSVGGSPYTGSYGTTHATDASGSFSGWNWIWTAGDPYGTYTFTFTDASGHEATATAAITHSTVAPTPADGTHLMLDTASAPPLATVQLWQQNGAPYTAIGVYIPTNVAVDDRHDKDQVNLHPDWVSGVEDGGWHVVPIHLGLQAPTSCGGSSRFHGMDADPAKALTEGTQAAQSAAAQSVALGIDRSVPVISDIEAYHGGCPAVQSYLAGWTNELHQLGWHAGVYGSPGSVAADLAAAASADASYVLPDVLWTATDNRRASTSVSGLPAGTWRIANQYLFSVTRTYGDTSLNIDESAVDDAVWSMGTLAPVPDRTAPIVTAAAAPWLIRTKTATFTWSGVDGGSGIASYDVRTMHTRSAPGSDAYGGVTTVSSATDRTSVRVGPGERVCVQVQAVDNAGNRSAWTDPMCTVRLADDRAAKAGPGWRRAHRRSAYEKTVTVANRKKAVLTLGTAVKGSRLDVIHSGGPLTVAVNGHKVGTLKGNGTGSLVLPRSGKVTLMTTTAKMASIDGYALAPRPGT